MKPRALQVAPQAQRDLQTNRQTLGPSAAAKAARTIQAGIRAAARIDPRQARRADFPKGYFRVVAKAHLIIFQIEGDLSRIVRILHGARDIPTALEIEKD
ncbi:MAG: type II toxin-antitoxin system RelE/ParE family toxin [Terricaulis sp.]|nr:type II toxin-antitoxin system RelE/ParE family toxin [Terricaulis sp.]